MPYPQGRSLVKFPQMLGFFLLFITFVGFKVPIKILTTLTHTGATMRVVKWIPLSWTLHEFEGDLLVWFSLTFFLMLLYYSDFKPPNKCTPSPFSEKCLKGQAKSQLRLSPPPPPPPPHINVKCFLFILIIF